MQCVKVKIDKQRLANIEEELSSPDEREGSLSDKLVKEWLSQGLPRLTPPVRWWSGCSHLSSALAQVNVCGHWYCCCVSESLLWDSSLSLSHLDRADCLALCQRLRKFKVVHSKPLPSDCQRNDLGAKFQLGLTERECFLSMFPWVFLSQNCLWYKSKFKGGKNLQHFNCCDTG